MANVVSEVASQIGKQVAKEATEVGKEAWRDANRRNTSFRYELKRKALERWTKIKHEMAETLSYLKEHPGRTTSLIVSASVFVMAFVLRKRA